jgi:hypothetical protein
MMAYRPYWDVDVCIYQQHYQVACVIITSTNPITPGSNINKGLNQCVYTCAFEMLNQDFEAFAEIYEQVMKESEGRAVITVDLDGSDGNQWKSMTYSPLFFINVIVSCLVCLVMIVLNTINLALIVSRGKTHMKIWILISTLLLISGVVGDVGFVDFNCFMQVLPYRACNIFSAMRPAFVFAAVNLLSYSYLDAVKMHVGGINLIPSKFWCFVRSVSPTWP